MKYSVEETKGPVNEPTWQKWLPLLGLVRSGSVVFVTLAGYMSGVIYYSAYLQAFQIDDRTFPVDTLRYWVYGAYSLYRLCMSIISNANTHPGPLALAVLIIVMYVMAAKALFYSAPKKETVQRAQKYVSRMRALWQSRQRLKSAAQGGIVALIALWGTAVSIFVIASVISIPLIVGQEGAKASYVQVSKGFIGGCAHPSGEYLCSKLYDQDKLVAEGFVIAASPDQVALYKDGTTSILDLKGRRLITEGLHLPNHKG